jgi:predicted dehydrogenase
VSEPLRIGVLGAARIADDGIVDPARVLGHRIVAVAARDRSRAEAFAAERGIERVHDGYAGVLADPEVEVVYNALVNSEHTRWNIAALEAGKHVLSEKPLSANAAEARQVAAAAATAGRTVVEGFHYLHHPVHARLAELVTTGALGDLQRVDVTLAIPTPPPEDPRWSLALAGGATMDLGCYVLHAARQIGRWRGGQPEVTAVGTTLREGQVDAAMRVELRYPGGLTGTAVWDMDAADRTMTWTVTGSAGRATSPAFGVPHLDNRLLVTRDGVTEEETLGDQTSYTYQLAALARTLRDGAPFPLDLDDAVANATLIDGCYAAAGLAPRGGVA